jgi:hypothetical protein
MSEIILMERDRKIVREIDRWRVCQGRHIRELAGFEGQRACDRRLRKLIEAGYIKREKILYGVAGIYSNTIKATRIGLPKVKNRKIRVEQINHDIAVVDTAIFFKKEHGIRYEDIKTEIELHRLDGFGVRKHRPDFTFPKDGKTICVEVELNLKAKDRFEKNIKDNFLNYDRQIWIVPDLDSKITKILEQSKTTYPNIEILELREVQETR